MPRHVEFPGNFDHTAVGVGDYVTVTTYNGTVIQHVAADTAPRPTRRASPQRRPPRDPVELVGRTPELERIETSLRRRSSVAHFGPAGVGKTVLLKHVAGDAGADWPDGVLYANVGAQQLDDVLQWLFTVFWDTGELVFAPGPLRVGEYLKDLRALVVLDDVQLSGEDIERLLAAAGSCGFAIGGAQPGVADASYPLGGLDAAAAAALFARVRGYATAATEQPDVDAFITSVEGLPGYVVTGAELVRDGICTPADLLGEPGAVLARRRLLALPLQQQQLLGLLAELAPAPVPAHHLGADAEQRLEQLRAGGFVERHSTRYTLAGPHDPRLVGDIAHMGAAQLLGRLAEEPGTLGADDASCLTTALSWGERAGEHEAVLRAARAFAPAALRAGRTGAWGAVARAGLTAAQRLNRHADEALFLHEQGTRLGCLGELEPARETLTRARDIRRELHDDAGALVTEHNMRELFGDPGGADPDDSQGGGGGGGRGMLAAALLIAAAVVAVAIAASGGSEARNGLTASSIQPPEIVIDSPIAGHVYTVGTRIRAHYRCTGASTCVGGVQIGVPVDGRIGTHRFAVRAATADGGPPARLVVTYTVKPAVAPTAPQIVISSPIAGHVYTVGTRIHAHYRCTGASTCVGGVQVGVPVDGRVGTHRFAVRAASADGGPPARLVVTYTVKPSVTPTAPQIVIDSPEDGATYDFGTRISAQYECTAAGSCVGDVGVGAPVDSGVGPHSFTVQATGTDGRGPVKRVVTYTVAAAAAPPSVDARAVLDSGGFTLSITCSGGTPPIKECSATMDGADTVDGAPIPCGNHTVVVTAIDAAGKPNSRRFPIKGAGCG